MKLETLPPWIRTHWRAVTLGALAAFFVVVTSILIVANRMEDSLSRARFDWPDETMNFHVARRVAHGFPIADADPLIAQARNRLHPRSMNVINSALVPGGFLGFPVLAGSVGLILRTWGILLLTPTIAVVGVFALVSIARRLFGIQVGWLTGVLAFTNPVLLYYTSFVMLPNVAFLSLVLVGFAVLLGVGERGDPRRDGSRAFLGGLAVGLALAVRTNELWWVGLAFCALLIARRRQLGRRNIAEAVFGGALAGIVLLTLNTRVYGHPFAFGYEQFPDSGAARSRLGAIFPFGLHPRLVISNAWDFLIRPFWWMLAPAVMGFGVWISYRRKPARQSMFAVLLVCVAAWLFLYYGSWMFDDPLTTRLNTIGVSYVRYWLPIVVGSLPFAALFVWSLGCVRGPRRIAAGIIVCAMAVLSLRVAFFSELDSLVPVARRIREYHRAARAIVAATPPESVIVTWRTDKIVFPERRVAAADLTEGIDAELVGVISRLRRIPWFLYARLTSDEESRVQEGLAAESLTMDSIGEPRPGETLYRIRKKL